MQNETNSAAFLRYGSTFKKIDLEQQENLICQTKQLTSQMTLSQLLYFSCNIYIEVQSGLGVLLVSENPASAPVEEFSMNRRFRINPNVYFGFLATTPELVVHMYVENDYSMDAVSLPKPYGFHPVLPRIQIQEIVGYYYRIRTPNYQFSGEQHKFFELTYVDTGTLYTEVDGQLYRLGEKEMIIYGPGQYHTQYTDSDQGVSYVTILFNMTNTVDDMPENWYDVLTNKVFPYNKKTYTLIKTLVQESTTSVPYMNSLMHCLLTETIIRLLQGSYIGFSAPASSVVRQNYQDELFERILNYVESKLYEPLTIAEICQQFSLSRSSLQLLFKNAVNQSPKKYISDMKLKKSCQMLRENKYTVSEISLKLGYSSIHYFSNAFSQKYHISPSEYAKRIY